MMVMVMMMMMMMMMVCLPVIRVLLWLVSLHHFYEYLSTSIHLRVWSASVRPLQSLSSVLSFLPLYTVGVSSFWYDILITIWGPSKYSKWRINSRQKIAFSDSSAKPVWSSTTFNGSAQQLRHVVPLKKERSTSQNNKIPQVSSIFQFNLLPKGQLLLARSQISSIVIINLLEPGLLHQLFSRQTIKGRHEKSMHLTQLRGRELRAGRELNMLDST